MCGGKSVEVYKHKVGGKRVRKISLYFFVYLPFLSMYFFVFPMFSSTMPIDYFHSHRYCYCYHIYVNEKVPLRLRQSRAAGSSCRDGSRGRAQAKRRNGSRVQPEGEGIWLCLLISVTSYTALRFALYLCARHAITTAIIRESCLCLCRPLLFFRDLLVLCPLLNLQHSTPLMLR